jgi:glucan-binding YG repeat protein
MTGLAAIDCKYQQFYVYFSMEQWKDIPGYEGYYQISSKGKVRSLDRVLSEDSMGRSNRVKGRPMKIRLDKKGYCTVGVSKDSVKKHLKVHRLVAQAFISNPHNKPQVNHINGDKTDNRVENLEWCTQRENNIHALKEGLRVSEKGEKHGQAKLKEEQVIEIRKLAKDAQRTQQSIADEFNVSRRLVGMITNRQIWTHI